MRIKDLLFGGVECDGRSADVGLLLLRVIAGLALALAHGLGKVPPSPGFVGRVGAMGLPAPELFAWLAGMAEFGGGLLLVVGLFTRPAALLIVVHFLFVVFLAHAGDPFGPRELATLFGAIALLYVFHGAGRLSLDAIIRERTL
jgi:putative oxidoreductase